MSLRGFETACASQVDGRSGHVERRQAQSTIQHPKAESCCRKSSYRIETRGDVLRGSRRKWRRSDRSYLHVTSPPPIGFVPCTGFVKPIVAYLACIVVVEIESRLNDVRFNNFQAGPDIRYRHRYPEPPALSRPPTPVSGCPLKRLEVQDGVQSRVYDSTHFASALTLTLEGQRSVGAECDSFVLLVHIGPRRMLSIRLSDLLQSPSGITEAVAVDKSSRQLIVKVPAQRQEIKARFEDGRDFSLAVCTLKKSGFAIKDDAPANSSKQVSSLSQANIDLGPRLSSITPLPGPDTSFHSGAHDNLSFTSLLNFSFMPPDSSQTASSDETMRREPQKQNIYTPLPLTGPDVSRQRMTADEAAQFLNPYNVFLNKQNSGLHRPRVSSPLRNAISPDDSVAPGQSSGCAYAAERNEDQPPARRQLVPRSISTSGLPSQRDNFDPPQPPESTSRRHSSDATASDMPPIDSQTRRQSPGASPNYRDHMPQRRDLPFKQHEPQATKERVTNPHGRKFRGSQGLAKSPDSENERKEAQVKRRRKTRTTTDQPRLQTSPNISASTSPNSRDDSESSHGSLESARLPRSSPETCLSYPQSFNLDPSHPTVLVADAAVLRKVRNITSALLEQYESDVSRGCDEGICARFYLEQMQSSRRDFWLSQLMDLIGGRS
ncbi:hypothetical protein TOPH_07192 [Tolypocladium ophioglossoides CBS 100239]|uniref:Uncharacterized protein n=1 Tax=Tolypocladium ophioglossoides (strain CBS 100239) TaxID=1163406 RepID=A0A0L0N2E7_TOLOC|nr:hypothetical protein TOPH_07192 [Tolypocladium ophioglossoides CBS 100239]